MSVQLDLEIRRLLFEHVTSYEQLETLFLLHAAPLQAWKPTQVAAALRIEVAAATAALTELLGQRLVVIQDADSSCTYRYEPADPTLTPAIDRLKQAYADQRLEVVKLMSANAIERVRSSAARTFSDAFVLWRKKDDR